MLHHLHHLLPAADHLAPLHGQGTLTGVLHGGRKPHDLTTRAGMNIQRREVIQAQQRVVPDLQIGQQRLRRGRETDLARCGLLGRPTAGREPRGVDGDSMQGKAVAVGLVGPRWQVVIAGLVAQLQRRELRLVRGARSRLQQRHVTVVVRLMAEVGTHQPRGRIEAILLTERLQTSRQLRLLRVKTDDDQRLLRCQDRSGGKRPVHHATQRPCTQIQRVGRGIVKLDVLQVVGSQRGV